MYSDCVFCGSPFIPTTSTQSFCSRECVSAAPAPEQRTQSRDTLAIPDTRCWDPCGDFYDRTAHEDGVELAELATKRLIWVN